MNAREREELLDELGPMITKAVKKALADEDVQREIAEAVWQHEPEGDGDELGGVVAKVTSHPTFTQIAAKVVDRLSAPGAVEDLVEKFFSRGK